jgi:hypothetical protein
MDGLRGPPSKPHHLLTTYFGIRSEKVTPAGQEKIKGENRIFAAELCQYRGTICRMGIALGNGGLRCRSWEYTLWEPERSSDMSPSRWAGVMRAAAIRTPAAVLFAN